MRRLLTFDDVLIVPAYSDIESRSLIDIGTDFMDSYYGLPIMSANMNYVTEAAMANAMLDADGFYVLHRFYNNIPYFYNDVDLLTMNGRAVSISIGVRNPNEQMAIVERVSKFGGGILDLLTVCVDTAHGHHQRVADMVKRLKDFGVQRVIAGNVATRAGYDFLSYAGADAIKVGIGPGAVCTTREVTGVGVPQLSALLDIQQYRNGTGPAVIADGGIKNSGDIVKALVAGAEMVMLGSLLAGTNEAPGEWRTDPDGQVWRPYEGQSIFGSNASNYVAEGVSGWVKAKGSVDKVLHALAGGIRSACSYVGARNLTELRGRAEFVEVTQSTHIESGTRIMRN